MSYKTDMKAKVSIIQPTNDSAGQATKSKMAAGSVNTAKDSYTTEQPVAGGYRMIVEGNRKHPRYDQEIQSILNGMGRLTPMSAGRSYAPEEEAILYVPDLEKDILGNDPERHNNMKPVLDRYLGLEKMLTIQIIEIDKSLKSGRGTTDEIATLWKKKEHYEKKLFECGKQLEKARVYYMWEKQNKAASV